MKKKKQQQQKRNITPTWKAYRVGFIFMHMNYGLFVYSLFIKTHRYISIYISIHKEFWKRMEKTCLLVPVKSWAKLLVRKFNLQNKMCPLGKFLLLLCEEDIISIYKFSI